MHLVLFVHAQLQSPVWINLLRLDPRVIDWVHALQAVSVDLDSQFGRQFEERERHNELQLLLLDVLLEEFRGV